MEVKIPPYVNYISGQIRSEELMCKETTLGSLEGVFEDKNAYEKRDPNEVIYCVEMFPPEQTEGELNFGVTHLNPGTVGNEYYMTRGHIHERAEQAEYYFGAVGEGLLILQNEQGSVTVEKVFPGSVHHIRSVVAHRLVNTGRERLSALAVWPAVAGHDYTFIENEGFGVRIRRGEDGYQIHKVDKKAQ
ncbi:glucose-6-phosphate isomerase family protein [Vibrio sp. TRT 21S02]|uniref:glucose-6-phosphate isomerase family protein n=1 Tax=Vibrio sp. TRT 21S02 TaxID=3418507 RepID=UPI003CF9A3BC